MTGTAKQRAYCRLTGEHNYVRPVQLKRCKYCGSMKNDESHRYGIEVCIRCGHYNAFDSSPFYYSSLFIDRKGIGKIKLSYMTWLQHCTYVCMQSGAMAFANSPFEKPNQFQKSNGKMLVNGIPPMGFYFPRIQYSICYMDGDKIVGISSYYWTVGKNSNYRTLIYDTKDLYGRSYV